MSKFKKIPYEQAAEIVKKIEHRFKELKIKFAVGGSYARKEKSIGDIDILVHEKCLSEAKRILKEIPGAERVEVYSSNDESWGAQLLHLYGDATFNIIMRSLAKKKGYILNQYGLFSRETGEKITSDEKEIFKLLELSWVPPWERKGVKGIKKLK